MNCCNYLEFKIFMKKKNLFDLLALKESVSANKYIQRLKPLQDEKSKISNILAQLNDLKENKNSNKEISAWELKSSSNIQKKIFDQIAFAENKIEDIKIEISRLEKKFIDHEIRRKRSIDKSIMIERITNLNIQKKLDEELQSLKKT
tara:strand:+ start:620 stop:1060 length:441 start_codon:yes stop_codon:yes gene_type:complete